MNAIHAVVDADAILSSCQLIALSAKTSLNHCNSNNSGDEAKRPPGCATVRTTLILGMLAAWRLQRRLMQPATDHDDN